MVQEKVKQLYKYYHFHPVKYQVNGNNAPRLFAKYYFCDHICNMN